MFQLLIIEKVFMSMNHWLLKLFVCLVKFTFGKCAFLQGFSVFTSKDDAGTSAKSGGEKDVPVIILEFQPYFSQLRVPLKPNSYF